MRKFTAALLPLALALALAGCDTMYDQPYDPAGYPPAPYPEQSPQPYPGPYPAPVGSDYRASGTEPFWDLTIGRDLVFNDRGTGLSIVEPAPPAVNGVAGPIYRGRRLEVNIVRNSRCNDGMSDRVYPDSVQVHADGRLYRGCGGLSDPLSPVPPGAPGGMVPNPLAGSIWRVVAINGIPVPPGGDYSIGFEENRLNARFGCNSLGAGYAWDGANVDAGAIVSTRMACQEPAARFEADGLRILEQPMRSHWLSGGRITLSNAAGSIDLRRM